MDDVAVDYAFITNAVVSTSFLLLRRLYLRQKITRAC